MVNTRPATFTSEQDVLLPRDPAQHSDNWTCFPLNDVEIYDSNDTSCSPSNLLHVGVHYVVNIRGRLGFLDKSQGLSLVSPAYIHARPNVEISGVREFSYGQYDDGTIELWAAGKAGWFTISTPHQDHAKIYEEMKQAVRLLYHIADHTGDESSPPKTGKLHKVDLILRTWAQAEGLTGGTEEAHRLLKKHADFLIASMHARKEGLDPDTNPVFRYLEIKFPSLVRQLCAPPPKIDEIAPHELMVAEHGSKKRKRKSETPVLDRRKGTTPRRSQSILSDETKTSGRPKSKRRKSRHETRPTEVASMDDNTMMDLESRVVDPDTRSPAFKGKSALRPKASKYVGTDLGLDSVHDTATAMPNVPNDRQDISTKRMQPPDTIMLDDDSVGADTRPPTPPSAQKPQSNHKPFDIKSLEISSICTDAIYDEGIDLFSDTTDPLKAFAPFQVNGTTYRLKPSDIKPTLKGDMWSCPLDGCVHKIYGASKPSAQKLINEHYRLHIMDADTEARLQLVRRMQGPGLSAKRLMSRIQILGGFPAPIVRRL